MNIYPDESNYDIYEIMQFVTNTAQSIIDRLMYFSIARYIYMLLLVGIATTFIIIFIKKRGE